MASDRLPFPDRWRRALPERLTPYQGREQDPVPRAGGRLASVAILLRPRGSSLDLLLIERAKMDRDPWSGHMALPGGRMEARDDSLYQTAVRETLEETGIDLARVGSAFGRLGIVEPATARLPPISILPFVFGVPGGTDPGPPNAEVARSLWVPVTHLRDPSTATVHRVRTGDIVTRFPGFSVEGGVVWGLTHRVLTDLLGRLPDPDG